MNTGGQPLDILNGHGQKALLAHVPDSGHTRIAEAAVLLCFCKRAFIRFLSPCVDSSALSRLRKGSNRIRCILPYMSRHHLSGHTCAEAFASSPDRCMCQTPRCIGIGISRRSLPCAYAAGIRLLPEFPCFPEDARSIPRVQSHELRRRPRPSFNFLRYLRHRRSIVDIRRLRFSRRMTLGSPLLQDGRIHLSPSRASVLYVNPVQTRRLP